MKMLCATIAIALTTTQLQAQEPAKPSKEHDLIMKSAGKWTGQMKMWPQGPDSDPITVPFEDNSEAVLGGFWLRTEFSAGPYHGSGMSGYDPVKKEYVGTWADNMSPHMSLSSGTFNEDKRALTMTFKGYDPASGKLVEHKAVTVYDSPGTPKTMTMYVKGDSGKFVKSFELTYNERAKSAR